MIDFNDKNDECFSEVQEVAFELEDLFDDLMSYQFNKNMNLIDIDDDELIEKVIDKISEIIKNIDY